MSISQNSRKTRKTRAGSVRVARSAGREHAPSAAIIIILRGSPEHEGDTNSLGTFRMASGSEPTSKLWC